MKGEIGMALHEKYNQQACLPQELAYLPHSYFFVEKYGTVYKYRMFKMNKEIGMG